MKTFFNIVLIFLFSTGYICAKPVRIMPLGDSITYDDAYSDHKELGGTNPRPASLRNGYRNDLWYLLNDAGFSVDFVGSRVAGTAVRPKFDPDNEGYPGETSSDIANKIYGKLVKNPSDIILLYIGANDWSDSVSGIDRIFNQIDKYEKDYNHHIKVFVARIVNRRSHHEWMSALNRNIQSLANKRKSRGDDIVVVEMEYGAGINYPKDFQDPTHPNSTGYNKIAKAWYRAMKPYMSSFNTAPSTPSGFVTGEVDAHTATLTWKDKSDDEDGFKIYRDSTLVATVEKNVTEYTLDKLDARTTYTYTIVAYNDNGDSGAQKITFTTKDDYAWLIAIYPMMGI